MISLNACQKKVWGGLLTEVLTVTVSEAMEVDTKEKKRITSPNNQRRRNPRSQKKKKKSLSSESSNSEDEDCWVEKDVFSGRAKSKGR